MKGQVNWATEEGVLVTRKELLLGGWGLREGWTASWWPLSQQGAAHRRMQLVRWVGRNRSTACEEIAKGLLWEDRDLRRSGDGKTWLTWYRERPGQAGMDSSSKTARRKSRRKSALGGCLKWGWGEGVVWDEKGRLEK